MSITDLTSLIRSAEEAHCLSLYPDLFPKTEQDHVYYCNSSLLYLGDSRYLVTYRRLLFFVPTGKRIHPWKLWDSGWKFLHKNPDRVEKSLPFGRDKYRDRLSPDFFISVHNKTPIVNTEGCFCRKKRRELDTTGMACIYVGNGAFQDATVEWIIPTLFGSDRNQDARLSRDEHGRLFITYNGFLCEKSILGQKKDFKTVMLVRQFVYEPHRYLYFHEEERLLPAATVRETEKNCVIGSSCIFYDIHGGDLKIVEYWKDESERTYAWKHRLSSLLHSLSTGTYRDEILFSLGTPPVPYLHGKVLMAIHVKMFYLHRYPLKHNATRLYDAFEIFLEAIRWETIYKHSKFIYFHMFLELDPETMEICRVSDPFLFRDSHQPYLLQFPTGLVLRPDLYKIYLSYGEGDVRCKLATLSQSLVESLLIDCSVMEKTGIVFRWIDEESPQILHYGYFFEENAGDDAFQLVFQYLHRTYYPSLRISFFNEYKAIRHHATKDPTLAILGGGDVMNPYFLKPLLKNQSHHNPTNHWALGVGMPILGDREEFEDLFSWIVTRNPEDHNGKMDYAPDLAFVLRQVLPPALPRDPSRVQRKIGLSLYRTVYQFDEEDLYQKYILLWVQILENILSELPDVTIYLLPFCWNSSKHRENDFVMNEHIKSFFRLEDRVVNLDPPQSKQKVSFLYHFIGDMDFMLCGRYHSHIFALCQHVPFVSFSTPRKCQQLLRALELPLDVSSPLLQGKTTEPDSFLERFFKLFREREQFHQVLLQDTLPRLDNEIDTFLKRYLEEIHRFFSVRRPVVVSSSL